MKSMIKSNSHVCRVLGISKISANCDFEIWGFKGFLSLDNKKTAFKMASRWSDLNIKMVKNTQEIHHKAWGRALVPLLGSKNEVVAPKCRTQNTFFGAVLEFVIKFAILVLNIKHQNGFFPEHLGSIHLRAEMSGQARISGPKPKSRPGILAWKRWAENFGLKFQAKIPGQNFRPKFQAKKSVWFCSPACLM